MRLCKRRRLGKEGGGLGKEGWGPWDSNDGIWAKNEKVVMISFF